MKECGHEIALCVQAGMLRVFDKEMKRREMKREGSAELALKGPFQLR